MRTIRKQLTWLSLSVAAMTFALLAAACTTDSGSEDAGTAATQRAEATESDAQPAREAATTTTTKPPTTTTTKPPTTTTTKPPMGPAICEVGLMLHPGDGCDGDGFRISIDESSVAILDGSIGGIQMGNTRMDANGINLNRFRATRAGGVWTIESLP